MGLKFFRMNTYERRLDERKLRAGAGDLVVKEQRHRSSQREIKKQYKRRPALLSIE